MVAELLRRHMSSRRRPLGDEQAFLSRLASEQQNPDAMYVGCCDSRVVPEVLTASTPGELFVVRNIANLIPPYNHPHTSVGAALEYAVGHLHVPHLIVCGHHGCGGIKAMMEDPAHLDHSPSLKAWLEMARPAVEEVRADGADQKAWWRRAVEHNVLEQLANAITYPIVAEALDREEIALHGWVYDLYSMELRVYDPERDKFARAAEVIGAG
ncbi:MAG: carbonic anhydrase [Polyangiaceae bacterium]|nr:carbonic anhydrase [Polyangiaceae bacterium]